MKSRSHSRASRSDAPTTFACGSPQHPRVSVRESIELLRDGFESLEEDFAEEQFFATIRAAYWKEAEGSSTRTACRYVDREAGILRWTTKLPALISTPATKR